MKISHRLNSSSALRVGSYAVLGSLLMPLAGCGGRSAQEQSGAMAQQPAMSRPVGGISTKQKVVLLAGAAALYYYYRKSKKATEAKYAGQNVQYFLSKNGGIYYRDPQSHKATFVTAPKTTSIPASEAAEYSGVQGYNGQTSGNGLDYYFNGPGGAASASAQ